MFDSFRRGDIRFIIGSTYTLGTGVNIQDKLIAAHHIDPPRDMTPASLTQRNGRILRQGNENSEVQIYYYGMVDTAAPGIYHRIQRKGAFSNQVLSGRGVGTEFEDCGDASMEEYKSMLIRDKRQLKLEELKAQIRDEKLKKEVSDEHLRSLNWNLSTTENRLKQLQGSEYELTKTNKAIFEKKVIPTDESIERDSEWYLVDKKSEKIDGKKEILKSLKTRIAEWKEAPLGNEVVKKLDKLKFNGLRLDITLEQKSLNSTETILMCASYSPDGKLLKDSKFGSAQALAKVVQKRFDEAMVAPQYIESEIQSRNEDLTSYQKQLSENTAYDTKRLKALEKEMSELEEDMCNNPYERKKGKTTSNKPVSPNQKEHQQELVRPKQTAMRLRM